MTSKNGFGIVICFIKDQNMDSSFSLICVEKALFDWPIVFQYDVKAKYRLISGKFSGMKFFHPSICLTNQKPRAFVSFRRTSQIALFRLFVVSVLFACFHFKVRRKSPSKDCKCIYSRCYSFKGATSRYLLSF